MITAKIFALKKNFNIEKKIENKSINLFEFSKNSRTAFIVTLEIKTQRNVLVGFVLVLFF